MWMPLKTVLTLMAAGLLAGCGAGRGEDVTLSEIRSGGNGPDEFSILPGKPLEMPADTSTLPTPAPGIANRTDQDPIADGIAALGGSARAGGGAPAAADRALVAHAGRYGRDPAIRQRLAAEDRELRRQYGNVNLLRILPGDDYVQAYRDQWLDAYAAERRLRRAGIRTPVAPPEASD